MTDPRELSINILPEILLLALIQKECQRRVTVAQFEACNVARGAVPQSTFYSDNNIALPGYTA